MTVPGGERASAKPQPVRPTLAVVGATGAVGRVLVDLLATRADVWGEVRLFAGPEGIGTEVQVLGRSEPVRALEPGCFEGVDIALFEAPEDVVEEWAPLAVAAGAVAVDGSSAFRLHPDVPLVVPEINPSAARMRRIGIIAAPRCATLVLTVALAALHAEFGLSQLVVTAALAASGRGRIGVDTLRRQTAEVAGDPTVGTRTGDLRRAVSEQEDDPFEAPLAYNLLPWAGDTTEDGWSSEELGLRNETRKILGLPELPISATCLRVPVVSGHSLTVHAVFEREPDVHRVREILDSSAGVIVYDDPEKGEYPTPADVVGSDPTWVGRVRRSLDEPHGLELFLCGDNLRKGAALNCVQIAELVAAEGQAG
ncbi:aspartate-semialdehyde dehydrogenase [Streptacidiphilus jiangxiensis]|uniref:aspartate-semialdehyde dehydrogenase n=1 Tax=Streptacidiphilus jiangxiensis TaxID=235985 RepID=A0A1H7IW72_STRJI|nr:aspartate-semialdehyde dehydrogenase [Streptacidiphilus jiangxiensis]SEK66699.1 aspartate-semialdehyde dehydrogenase [Streptacidiphilus jiangxiensis]